MNYASGLLAVTGVLALIYGVLILWNFTVGKHEAEVEDWLNAAELRGSRFNNMHNLRHLLKPERKNISFNRSKSRGFAMLGIGVILLVFAFI